jgi:hypothetical protein
VGSVPYGCMNLHKLIMNLYLSNIFIIILLTIPKETSECRFKERLLDF